MAKRWIVVRIVGWLAVVGALIWCLRAVGVPWRPVWAWFWLSGAVVFVLEAGLWERLRQEKVLQALVSRLLQMDGDMSEAKQVEAELERVRLETDQLRRDTTQQLIGVALLVAVAFGMALAAHGRPARPGEPSQMTVNFSGGIEERPVTSPQKLPSSGSNETTLRLNPDLERDLSAYFRTPPQSEGGSGLGWFGLFIVLVLIFAEVVLLFWAFKHRPSAVPLIGAADLAALVIKNADHLSRPGGSYFWWAVYIFLGIGFLLVVAGVIQVIRRSKAGQAANSGAAPDTADVGKSWRAGLRDWIKGLFEGKAEATKEESLLNVGVSALILAWSLLLLAQPPEIQPPGHFDASPQIPPPAIGVVLPLTGPKFESGLSDTSGARESDMTRKGIDHLRKELSENAKEGDVVLLIGSTDCTSFRKGNNELANERATNVSDSLRNVVSGVEIQIPSQLPQHDNCKGSADLRAVHPYLIPLKRNEK